MTQAQIVERNIMKVSYSFHVGSRKHTINNVKDLRDVENHNIRNYDQDSDTFAPDDVITIFGTQNLYQDVKNLYSEEFDEAVVEHNKKQNRKALKIKDYFYKISDQKNKSLAEEIIFGIGTKKFWEDKFYTQQEITKVFEEQLKCFQEIYPNFKVANATIHYDEAGAPHMHVVGIPIKINDEKKKLSKEISKRAVFNTENLEQAQDKLRENMLEHLNKCKITLGYEGEDVSGKFELQLKTKGHKYRDVGEYKEIQDYKNDLDQEYNQKTEDYKNELNQEHDKKSEELENKENKLKTEMLEMTKMTTNFQKSKIIQNKQDFLKAEKVKNIIELMYSNKKINNDRAVELIQEIGFEYMEGDWVFQIKPEFGINYVNVINEMLEVGLTQEQVQELKTAPTLSAEDHFSTQTNTVEPSNIEI